MNVIKPMPDTGALCWPARLLKSLLLISVIGLSGCSTTYVAPKPPAPAADLMEPEPTGSEYLSRASRNMTQWQETLQGLLTK